MSEPDLKHELVAGQLVQRLRSYALGLGLDDAEVWQIVKRVITEMPDANDIDRLDQARFDMLVAAL